MLETYTFLSNKIKSISQLRAKIFACCRPRKTDEHSFFVCKRTPLFKNFIQCVIWQITLQNCCDCVKYRGSNSQFTFLIVKELYVLKTVFSYVPYSELFKNIVLNVRSKMYNTFLTELLLLSYSAK